MFLTKNKTEKSKGLSGQSTMCIAPTHMKVTFRHLEYRKKVENGCLRFHSF